MKSRESTHESRAIGFLLQFARAAHDAGGYPAYELEPRIEGLAKSLGIEHVQVSATPTLVNITVGDLPDQKVYMLRVDPHPINLHAIGRLDEMASARADGRIDRVRALEEIDELGRNPIRRPAWIVLGAYGMVGAFLVGLAGNAMAHRFRRSPLTFIVPGLLLLIPGSFGYQGATSLLAGRTLTGIDLAVETFVTMLAIAYGLVAATLILPDDHAARAADAFVPASWGAFAAN